MKLPRNFKNNFSLKKNNSLKLDYKSDFFVVCNELEDLEQIYNFLSKNKVNFWVIGEGTNLVIKNNLNGLVIKNNLKGFEVNKNFITVGAGENWDSLVNKTLELNLYGLENLSGIPGSVGAAPIQNIGAYGAEVSDFISYVEVINLTNGSTEIISNEECKFIYRGSIFKSKSYLLITKICFCLSNEFKSNTHYKDLSGQFNCAEEIRERVLSVRSQKLLDHLEIPNVGSFFQNPIIKKELFNDLVIEYPDLKFYQLNSDLYKIPAAWLIEKAGWKGTSNGEAGISDKHALIFYNHSNKANDILTHSSAVVKSIADKFKISLDYEPAFIS